MTGTSALAPAVKENQESSGGMGVRASASEEEGISILAQCACAPYSSSSGRMISK